MLDDGHTGLVAIRIDIGKDGDIQPRRLEIALVVEFQIWLRGRRTGHQRQA